MSTVPFPSQESLSLAEYAALVGLSVKTVRRKVRNGEIAAELIDGPHGPEYRVAHPTQETGQGAQQGTLPERVPTMGNLEPLLGRLDTLMSMVDRLSRENLELAGRCGFLQAKLQDAEAEIRLLKAPAETSTIEANHSAEAMNGGAGATVQPTRPWWKFWGSVGT